MSVISEKIRKSLYAKMNVAAVHALATGGIHYQVAGENDSYPFVVFSDIPVSDNYALGGQLTHETDEWLIKALADEDSSSTLSPPALCEAILAAIEAAIGGALTVAGSDVLLVRRVRRMPPFIETLTDRSIYHRGFYLRVITS